MDDLQARLQAHYEARTRVTGAENVRAWERSADFRGMALRGAHLAGHVLTGADFRSADLRDASFVASRLEYANFSGADLRGASFHSANLYRAIFTGALIEGANFTGTLACPMAGKWIYETDESGRVVRTTKKG
jgi:uncharacterized protein YjbI with pentapeptide repeats